MLDAYGVRVFGNWIAFTAWLIVIDNASFLTLTATRRGPALWGELLADKWRVLASGLLGLASFCVFLWALGRGPVGAVSALRETSMLFAILIGVLLHRERLTPARLAAAILMVLGVVAIAAWS